MHIKDEILESLTASIVEHLDGQPYVLVTTESEPSNPEKTDVDYLSNLPPAGAAQLLRDTAEVLDSVEEDEEEPPIEYAG